MSNSERRIERVAMYAANTDTDGADFNELMREKVPGVTLEEINQGLIRGGNRLSDRVRAKFGMPPEPGIPEGPLDHGEDKTD